ncbi:HAD hydrolase family protein [Streptomyces sp. MST-110588]|uniref:HAD hydrolase family protein n=1 Tax=Streptomyces sp. MST-110588 TaxID=2833628 RepID=UPI001F5E1D9E|nr:HAD hydrolase family protein [Streptomyces sp. MST-110588]
MTEDPAASASASRPARPVRLIATDLDGTLLRDDKSVSDRTIAALAAAERAGIEVFFVTGRPARWMDVVSDHVHGHGLAICANGAAVVDLHRGRRVIDCSPLARTDALAVVHALRSVAPGTSFAVERTNGIDYEPGYPPLQFDPTAVIAPADKLLAEAGEGKAEGAWQGEADGEEGEGEGEGGTESISAAGSATTATAGTDTGTDTCTGTGPGNPATPADGPVIKLLAFHPDMDPDAFLTLARTTAGAHASFTRSSPTALLEISGLGVSKAGTLARCCAKRGIAAEEVVAFGDMPNDLEMLIWAGTSYAMANAHPDVLAATTHRTASNNEDGVAAVIERLIEQRAQ